MKISKKDFFWKTKVFSKSKHFVRYLIPIFLYYWNSPQVLIFFRVMVQFGKSKFKSDRTEEIQGL